MFGVKSFAPVILSPQAGALALGAIQDTVVPREDAKVGEDNWKVSPVMVVTLSCDHRVVDGAVGASWLSVFKNYLENPVTLLL
jgi:pyruvate dehydrogenase E2 component (dihydrolipoamide acetyltransferase)